MAGGRPRSGDPNSTGAGTSFTAPSGREIVLYGTTAGGGACGAGTVREYSIVPEPSSQMPVLVCLAMTAGAVAIRWLKA
jgi:hypothetical protein